MARPQRHNVDYFPHYISDGKKMFIIESKFGNDGYAAWFKILETLAKTDDHWLDLNDEANLMYISAKCRISYDKLIEIIEAVVKLGEIDSELWAKEKVLWCQKFIDSIDDAYRKRGNQCITIESLRQHLRGLGRNIGGLGELKGGENPQSKVDNTKLKEIRELTFREQVAQTNYSNEMKDAFCNYWTESKTNGKKMRFEMQKTFDIARRLVTWSNNDFSNKIVNGKPTKPETPEDREARLFMETIKDYNTHKNLYGEDSANEKFKFNEPLQSDFNSNRIA